MKGNVMKLELEVSNKMPTTVILRYSEGSASVGVPARSFGVPQDDRWRPCFPLGRLTYFIPVLLLAFAGCVEQTKTDNVVIGGTARFPAGMKRPDGPGPNPAAEQFVDDPCGDQMHDIVGALVMYHNLYHHLPEKLEEVQAALPGIALKFTCPTSGKPYVYVPAGLETDAISDQRYLQTPGGIINDAGPKKRIILYDPEASHQMTVPSGVEGKPREAPGAG